jgi:hypothetical protein
MRYFTYLQRMSDPQSEQANINLSPITFATNITTLDQCGQYAFAAGYWYFGVSNMYCQGFFWTIITILKR